MWLRDSDLLYCMSENVLLYVGLRSGDVSTFACSRIIIN